MLVVSLQPPHSCISWGNAFSCLAFRISLDPLFLFPGDFLPSLSVLFRADSVQTSKCWPEYLMEKMQGICAGAQRSFQQRHFLARNAECFGIFRPFLTTVNIAKLLSVCPFLSGETNLQGTVSFSCFTLNVLFRFKGCSSMFPAS